MSRLYRRLLAISGSSSKDGRARWWQRPSSPMFRIALLSIFLIAFGLRVFDLDGQSMWNDEGLSAYRARQSIPTILENTITIDGIDSVDTNPPLYFLLLHFMGSLAGQTVFSLRMLGVLIGVINVALVYILARISFNRLTALAGSFLLALSPFHVWMSQEMRNYTLLLLFNLLAAVGLFLFILRANPKRRFWWLGLWGAASILAVYTHYFGLFAFGFGCLALVIYFLRLKNWLLDRRIVGIGILLALLTVPPILTALSRFRGPQQSDFSFVPLHHLLSHAASVFSVGIIPTVVQPLWRVVPVAALAILGIIFAWNTRTNRQSRGATWLLLGYLFIPILLLFGLSVVNPLYNGPRHLLMSLPPYLILVAAGITLPWRPAAAVSGGLANNTDRSGLGILSRGQVARIGVILLGGWLVISQANWLFVQFTSTDLRKDDVRGLADYLNITTRDGDLVILHDSIIRITFEKYYYGEATLLSIPRFDQTSEEAAIARLEEASKIANRIWFVTEPTPRTRFPPQALIDWAGENWPKQLERRFSALWLPIKLELFVPEPTLQRIPASATAADYDWDRGLQLVGYDLPSMGQAGSSWQPAFYWKRTAPIEDDVAISLRLADEKGQIWAQDDRALWEQYPPSNWPVNQVVIYRPIISLPVGMPPGSYNLELRLVQVDNGQPLAIGDKVDVDLSGHIDVEAATSPADLFQQPTFQESRARFGGGLKLIGYHLPESVIRPGHIVPIDLYWEAEQIPSSDYMVRIRMVGEKDEVIAEELASMTRENYPPTKWQEDEILRGQAVITVPATAESETYQLSIALLDPSTGDLVKTSSLFDEDQVSLGNIAIAPWPMETELPDISVPWPAEFGNPPIVELRGFELEDATMKAGTDTKITLFWRSLSDSIDTNYSVFLHLTAESEDIIAQDDGVPVNGFRPTTSWRDAEVFIDLHSIAIPPDAEPGNYNLWTGFYNPETGVRLPVTFEGLTQEDDRLLLGTIRVLP